MLPAFEWNSFYLHVSLCCFILHRNVWNLYFACFSTSVISSWCMFCAFLISEMSGMDVIAAVTRAEETGRQQKTSVFESYLADLFAFSGAVSVAILWELCKNGKKSCKESYWQLESLGLSVDKCCNVKTIGFKEALITIGLLLFLKSLWCH